MSAKRPPTAAGPETSAPAKTPVQPKGKTQASKARVAPKTIAVDKSVAVRGKKAAAKIKAKAKPKFRADSPKAPLAKQPTVAAKSRGADTPRAEPKARPRLRHAGGPAGRLRTKGGRTGASIALARFAVGDVVRHKFYPFRGVVFDIDPVFANSDEWWLSIPEQMRPKKNQPFYHLLAENAETEYIAYVSEQNLLPDTTGVPVRHPQVSEYFVEDEDGRYRPVFMGMLN